MLGMLTILIVKELSIIPPEGTIPVVICSTVNKAPFTTPALVSELLPRAGIRVLEDLSLIRMEKPPVNAERSRTDPTVVTLVSAAYGIVVNGLTLKGMPDLVSKLVREKIIEVLTEVLHPSDLVVGTAIGLISVVTQPIALVVDQMETEISILDSIQIAIKVSGMVSSAPEIVAEEVVVLASLSMVITVIDELIKSSPLRTPSSSEVSNPQVIQATPDLTTILSVDVVSSLVSVRTNLSGLNFEGISPPSTAIYVEVGSMPFPGLKVHINSI